MLLNYISLTITVMIKVNLLNPWTVTGLTDGDGSFYVTMSKVLKIK